MKFWRKKLGDPWHDHLPTREPHDTDVPRLLAAPPAFFFAPLFVGLALHFMAPWQWGSGPWRVWGGALILAGGFTLSAWAIQQYRLARTSPDPKHRATALITTGPYRLSRNPLYIAMTIIVVGFATMIDRPWIIVALVPSLVLLEIGVVRREERYLQERFGEGYRAYAASVRRWV